MYNYTVEVTRMTRSSSQNIWSKWCFGGSVIYCGKSIEFDMLCNEMIDMSKHLSDKHSCVLQITSFTIISFYQSVRQNTAASRSSSRLTAEPERLCLALRESDESPRICRIRMDSCALSSLDFLFLPSVSMNKRRFLWT